MVQLWLDRVVHLWYKLKRLYVRTNSVTYDIIKIIIYKKIRFDKAEVSFQLVRNCITVDIEFFTLYLFTIVYFYVFVCKSFYSCFHHRNSIGDCLLCCFFTVFGPKISGLEDSRHCFLTPKFNNFN